MDEELRSLNPRVHCVSGQIQSTSSLPRSQICLQVVDKGGTSAANDPSAAMKVSTLSTSAFTFKTLSTMLNGC